MSKYAAAWLPNELNKDFWTEVLVGRTIKSRKDNFKAVAKDGPLREDQKTYELGLDSAETIWLAGDSELPDDAVGQVIQFLAWDEEGIQELHLGNAKGIKVGKGSWRICIQD